MSSDINNIIIELKERFQKPKEYPYKRRIIFWHDEEREFEDEIDSLYIPDVKIIHLTGNNTFKAKKTLSEDDTLSDYLVYSPLSYEKDDDNWLINVELYSEEFRADQISIWIDEMNMPDNLVVRKLVKDYRKFFNSRDRRQSVRSLNLNYKNPSQIPLAIMAVISGQKEISPAGIIKSVISKDLYFDTNTIYQNFVSYGIDAAFWKMVQQATGFVKGEDVTLSNLVIHIMLTAATNTVEEEILEGLDRYISIPNKSFCYDLIFDWLHSDDKEKIYELARYTEKETKIVLRFKDIDVVRLVPTEIFPCIDESILTTLMTDITEHDVISVKQIKSVVERRRTTAWYESYKYYYDGLYQIANIEDFYLSHREGFHLTDPKEIWQAYMKDYYLMDTYYRCFQMNFQQSLSSSVPILEDLFKNVVDKVEGLYSNWFLNNLGENWTKAISGELKDYGTLPAEAQLTGFYDTVKITAEKNRVFVIISDALRYEVAVELGDKLKHDVQCTVETKARGGIFPSVTKFGMAALLPGGNNITVKKNTKNNLDVYIDDMPTDGLENRDKILKKANPKSIALKFDDIIGMKKQERVNLVKGMDIVYFYHDRIDETGHTHETDVFTACEKALDEITRLVKIIANEFNSTNIYITSDHGFLYTYSPFEEYNKINKNNFVDEIVELDRRYVITEKDAEIDSLMPVRFLRGRTQYNAFTPRENLRIKKSGSGINYVHGGVSLQEILIPVIYCHFLRNQNKNYLDNKDSIDKKPVEVALLSTTRKITNMIFTLNFGQMQVVSGNMETAHYNIYFEDEHKNKVSDVQKIIADKTTEDEKERTFSLRFSLRSQAYSNLAKYYLVIEDESGHQAPKRIEFIIDIAFAVDDFNFF